MLYNNNATHFRREILVRLASLMYEDTLEEKIDRIPLEMIPKNASSYRCCRHHDRAVIKFRTMAGLGLAAEDEEDELTRLSTYAAEALRRETVQTPILTVAHEACSACVKSHYFVTNACRGCVARPCQLNCPKKSISIEKGQAKIDPQSCVNCGLCQKVCPYHAIVKIPVPCEEACPVGAIRKDDSGKETIDYTKCIFCGKCMAECPFGAVMERSQIVDVIRAIKSGRRVTALLAPAVAGQFPADMEKVLAAVRMTGFSDAVEVALGADETIEKEAEELRERLACGKPFMTTSCCPAYTDCVALHVPELKDFVSATRSPMHYTAAEVKKAAPDSLTVFIGPCVAKKKEALSDEFVDFVLNTEELGALFVAKGIDIAACAPQSPAKAASAGGRGFPVAGNVARAISDRLAASGGPEVRTVLVNGFTPKTVRLLQSFATGRVEGELVEVMACEGGCVAGPAVISKPQIAARKIADFAARSPRPLEV